MPGWLQGLSDWLEQGFISQAVIHSNAFGDFSGYGHYFGFFVVVGISLTVDLHILGVCSRQHSARELAQWLMPWMWGSLALVLLTGTIYLAPSASAFFVSSYFYFKLLAMVLGAATMFVIQKKLPQWDQRGELPWAAKLLAVFSILCWIGTIILGTHVPLQTGQ